MAKLKLNNLIWNKKLKQKGKIIAIDTDGGYKVEVIKSYDKETGTRTTTLTTWYDGEVELYRKPEKRKRANFKSKQKDTLLFAKVKSEATIPTKRYEDGCFDVYVLFDEEEVLIKPHEIKLFSTGIATAVSPKYRLDFKRERGSTGTIGLVPRSGQVDSGYRGEVFVPLQNTTNKNIVISKKTNEKNITDDEIVYPYTKAVCQMAVEIVPDLETKEITFEELQAIPSERGKGSLGSSGK